jgi:hypothetical protein
MAVRRALADEIIALHFQGRGRGEITFLGRECRIPATWEWISVEDERMRMATQFEDRMEYELQTDGIRCPKSERRERSTI